VEVGFSAFLQRKLLLELFCKNYRLLIAIKEIFMGFKSKMTEDKILANKISCKEEVFYG
jgi:hypothetical protein